jgi:hypothetical protein
MPANLPYPLQFDPSQWKNPYSRWAGVALPFSSTEVGPSGLYGDQVPTDAMGNPIQSYVDANNTAQANYQAQLAAYNAGGGGAATPGTTLNSTGGSAAAGGGAPQAQTSGSWPGQAQGAAAPGSLMATPAMQELMANYQASPEGKAMANNPNAALMGYIQSQDQNIQAYPQGGSSGFGSGNSGPLSAAQRDMMTNNAMTLQQLQAQGAAAPAASGRGPPPSPPNMTQAYLSALQRPGKVITPGATVAAAPPPSNQSNVLQQFLADWQGGGGKTTGAGNYNNKGFFGGLVGNV